MRFLGESCVYTKDQTLPAGSREFDFQFREKLYLSLGSPSESVGRERRKAALYQFDSKAFLNLADDISESCLRNTI